MKKLLILSLIGATTLVANAQRNNDPCVFDPPPVIEKLFLAAAKESKPLINNPCDAVGQTFARLVKVQVARTANQATCPHGVPVDPDSGVVLGCCWQCSSPKGGNTVPAQDRNIFQESLNRMSKAIIDRRLQEANIAKLMKNPDTLTALQVVDYALRTSNSFAWEDLLDRPFAKNKSASEVLAIGRYAIAYEPLLDQLFMKNKPAGLTKHAAVWAAVLSVRDGNNWLTNAACAAAAVNNGPKTWPPRPEIPPIRPDTIPPVRKRG